MAQDSEKALFEAFQKKTDQLHAIGNVQAVKAEAQQLLALNPTGFNHRSYAAACLIDVAEALHDITCADTGIALIEELLQTQDLTESFEITLKYNLANGYAARSNILFQDKKLQEAEEALHRSQATLEDLIIRRKKIAPGQLAAIYVNYANSLDRLGRTVEAIDYYLEALRIYPSHPNAAGNCGIAIERMLSVSSPHVAKNAFGAWNLLKSSCEQPDQLIQIAGKGALDTITARLAKLTEEIEQNFDQGVEGLKAYQEHRQKVHGQPDAPKWLAQINRERLLVTLNLLPLDSSEECADDLFFQSIVTEIKEGNERFNALVHTLNNIKEDFATARYLFYLPDIIGDEQLATVSSVTQYGDALDYADFGLLPGINKASFRLAADCLDKIAIFLNQYFRLGHDEVRVSFNNIWFENLDPKKAILHPVLEKAIKANRFLKALFDLRGDWLLGNFPGPLKSTRNIATHRGLVLYWMKLHGTSQGQNPEWDLDSFREATLLLLRMIKAAILYLVCAVTVEEANKKDPAKLTPSVFFRKGVGISDELVLKSQKKSKKRSSRKSTS